MGDCCNTVEPGIGIDPVASKRIWIRLGIALVIAGQSMVLGLGLNMLEAPLQPQNTSYWILHCVLILSALAVVGLLGKPLFQATWQGVLQRRITVEALFFLSFVGAFGASLVATFTGVGDVYYEVVAVVMCVYTVGKSITVYSRSRAMAEVEQLREGFQQATVLTCCGNLQKVLLSELDADARVVIAPGEPVTVDGRIVSGRGYVLETAMTGEPVPVVRNPGDSLLAGTYSVDGRFEVKPEHWRGDRQLDAVLQTVEAAQLQPSSLQLQADRIVQWFVPLVTAVSGATYGIWLWVGHWTEALFNSMAVLLVACPCALGLATPIAVWSGLYQLSKLGLVARTGYFLDALARADHIVFDKTGTLSEESLQVERCVVSQEWVLRRDELLRLVQVVEREHSHPLAQALSLFVEREVVGEQPGEPLAVQAMHLLPGSGVSAEVVNAQGTVYAAAIGTEEVANVDWGDLNAATDSASNAGKRIYVAVNQQPAAVFLLNEVLRAGTEQVFQALKQQGLKVSILTGDPDPQWQSIAGLQLETGLTPQDKTDRIREWQAAGDRLIFLGDGINDSGPMAACTGSIAMGQGASLTRSTAACVLLGKTLEGLPKAIKVARNVFAAIRGNMIFAVSYNTIGMGLAAAGILHPVVAALLMVGSSVVVAIRAFRSACILEPPADLLHSRV